MMTETLNSELPSSDSDHWLNGFLQQNCEEQRKRVLDERTLWNFTEDENSQDECDLSGIFNFNEDEDFNGQVGDEMFSSKNLDFSILPETKRATYNGGLSSPRDDATRNQDDNPDMSHATFNGNISIHNGEGRLLHNANGGLSIPEDERRLAREATLDQDENPITTCATFNDSISIHEDERRHDATPNQDDSHSKTGISRQHLIQTDGISIKSDELRVGHDACEKHSTEHVPNTTENGESGLDFETELVEIASMEIVHSKQQLLKAIDEFNKNVVEMERLCFMQMMLQIEETVNEILAEVERLDGSFKLQRMSPDSYYELKTRNEVDVLVVLQNVSPKEFVIEDMKTPTGYARIRLTSSEMTSSDMTSTSNMASSDGNIFHWCTEIKSGEVYFSPKKMCKKFAALVSRASAKILRHGSSVHRKRVTFSDREVTVPFVVNLIPTVACPQTWPLCAYWLRNYTKKWPAQHIKDDVIHGGMHLVAMATSKETDPLWQIRFCSARRRLLQSDCDGKKKCLRVLKVLLDKDLSRPKGIMPLYLENIVLWASRKHWQEEEWAECMLADRFLEMLVALHKCLENNDCYHFFVPTMNLFSELKPDTVKVLAAKVEDILHDPFKYLKT